MSLNLSGNLPYRTLGYGIKPKLAGEQAGGSDGSDGNNSTVTTSTTTTGNTISATDIYLAKQEILDKSTSIILNDTTLTEAGRKFILSNINSLIERFTNNYLTDHTENINSMSKDFMNQYFPDGKCDTILKELTIPSTMTKGSGTNDNIAVTVQSGNTQNIDCSFKNVDEKGNPITITQYSIARIGTSAGVRAEDSTFSLDPASGMLTVKAGGQPGTIYLTIIGLGSDGKAYAREIAITIETNANGKPIDDSDTIQQERESTNTDTYGNYSENNWTTDIKEAREQALTTLKNYLEEIRNSLLQEGYSQTALSVALNSTYAYYSNIITNMTDQVGSKHRSGKIVSTPDGESYTQITRYNEDKIFDGKRGKGNIVTSPTGLYLLEDKNAFKKNQFQIVFDKNAVLDKFIDEYKKAGGSNGSVNPGIVD